MKKLFAKIRKILRDRRTRRFLTRFVSGIAAIVVFVTTYALVLPAITMEKEADCGIEAHQHDDSCYTRELICDIPESDGHQHDESCYSTTTSLMCGMDEHEHSLENGCYDDDGNLICEAEEHKHSDGCYEEVRELTCQTPESERHHHTGACYEKVLSCGKEVHVHSAACYENDPVPDSAVAAGTCSAAAATTSAVSVSSVGMTLSFEGDNAGTGETDEPAVIEQPADQGRSGGDDGFVDNAGSVERDESGKSDGSEKSAGSGKTDSSVEAASSGEVNADDTVEMTYGSENAGTGSTETANAALTNTDNGPAAADQYVPTLEAVDFNTILNDRTGIYYYHVADGETVEDSSAIPAEDWKRIPNNKERMKNMDEPELGSNDLLRVYLSYTIPAGSLNATNPVARYRLPSNLHLTDSQVKAINENVNGMTGQYVDMSALEITDPARYYAYLGVEAVEGNRRPDEAVEDYLAEQARKTGTDPDEAAEYISAVVRVENVYDVDGIYGDKDAYLGQDLIFTFAPYSIEKNQHEYDSKGQPTKAGREIEGWFTLDLNMGQVDLGEAEITTSTVVESEADYADGNAEADRAEDGRTEDDRTEDDRAEDGRTEDENAADGQTEDEHNANDNNAENSVEDKDNNPAGESEEDTENPQNNTVTIEHAERTAEIVFVEDGRDGKNNKIEKISTRVRVVEETVIQTQDNDAEENSEESGAGNTEKSAAGSTEESAADNDADRSGKEKTDQTVMPAMSFTDSIRVSTGKPAGIDEDAEGTLGSAVRSLPQEAEVTVRVEADEGTFPAGTTMVLKAVEDLDAVAEAVTETVENSDPSVSADDADHQSGQTKESRNSNTEEKKNLKTYGFQAVDITFLDKNGKDIQPAKPVRVALTSEIAEQVKEEAKTSEVADPLVVHVDDDGNAEQMELLAPEEIKPAQGKTEEELLEEDRTSNSEQEENGTTDAAGETPSVGFTADSFSVYALVYTVDFYWEVDGKVYEFSLPGGGFVSLEHLMEVLGIAGDDADETGDDIYGGEKAGNAVESSVYQETIDINTMEVSEETKAFAADVESVEFSTPELVWVGKAENRTTAGSLKEANKLNCQYSAELTEEQIEEINAQTVEAGDWALISMRPFTSEETLTVTMKNGERFVVKVTDAQYDGSKVTALNGATGALINKTNKNAVLSTAQSTIALQAVTVTVDGNKISTTAGSPELTQWTFTYIGNWSGNDHYQISCNDGYLNLGSGSATISSSPQNLIVVTRQSNGETQIRIANDSHDALNNTGNNTANGYSAYNNWGYTNNPGEWFTVYALSEHHVTVHYVDRNGNVLTGVQYTGGNQGVVDNGDGTFTVSYNVTADVDLRANFDFSNVSKDNSTFSPYTYGSTHLAGDGDYSEITHEGYVIDSLLTASSGDITYHSDSGETSRPYVVYDPGSREYQKLVDYSLSGVANKRPSGKDGQVEYAKETDKDIYVILDPLPGPSASSPSGGTEIDAAAPDLSKTMKPNDDDGTYTLSLRVDAHGKNLTETNRANILFIVDTSSSMRKETTNGKNRIQDTQEAILDFGQDLLAYNTTHPNAVQVSMITFDGGVDDRLPWTTETTTFESAVNTYLEYPYLHQGTDWEDALKRALEILREPPDNDPTFVVFFTDGEPSQYTNFHGAQINSNADPTGHYTGENDDPGTSYPNYYSYFLSRETSKDEMRALVDKGVQLYGIYAYNPPPSTPYVSYLGSEGGAQLLHNALKYGYNAGYDTTDGLTNDVFFDAQNTSQLQGAFDKIFNSITEKVGFSNVVVEDGITVGVTSSTVLEGDVSAFTYTIRDNAGNVAYTVKVAPNGVPDGQTVEDGTPVFTIGSGTPVIGEKKTVSTKKIKTDEEGVPDLDNNGKFQTEDVDVEVYYYKDVTNNKEYIMPIATTGQLVSWDLSPLGLLKDGYSYEVSFVVWPNQNSYDLVADLNNGKRPDIEETADWDNCPIKTDSAGRQYRQGGFPDYPYISRYESDGVYSAMSNTDQKIDYYKFDTKIVQGLEVTEITHGSKEVLPPDPMPLTASLSRIEKLWNYERNPALFAQYLYNTDGSSKGFVVDFDVFQGDNLTTPYTTESLGWVYDLDANGQPIYLGENESGDYVLEEDEETHVQRKVKGHYVWAFGDTTTNVTYAGHAHQIGTRWVTDFSIATGLILTEGEMNKYGLSKSLYPSTEYGTGTNRKTYYILEPGHDYTIAEHQAGTIGYEFDFNAPVYHPMLIDGVLKNVEITYTYKTDEHGKQVIDTATISSITGSNTGLSGLEVQNTLRGYINLNKVVVDENNQHVESDNTKFEYTIKLESSLNPGPFEGTHIPWYGVNELYYNDGNETYYQVYEAQGGIWMIRNEAGQEYPVTSTGFDPDEAGEQTVTYDVNGQEKQVTLYGNQLTATPDGKTATATLAITQNETLYIANVPKGTKYTITEKNKDEYTLVDILKEVKHGSDVEQSEHVANLNDRTAIGTIVTNRDNHVTYTNKVLTGGLKITKTIQKNGSTDTSATGTFYYAVYDEEYNPNADPAQTPVRTGPINVTANGTATVTEENLKIGTYYVYELTGENGTPVTSGGIFNGGKYFAVTTTGSPATVEYGGTSTVDILNNYVTIPVTATKSWSDNNPQQLTVYFKLFYENAGGVAITTGTPLKPLANGVTSVTWPDLPKYDENGNEYHYIVREYVLDDTNGEFEENGHKYMEAAPSGYVNTEEELSVTNSKITTYEPVTTYSGLKVWVDTVNGGMTRPDGLTVTLMIDNEPYNDPAGDVPVTGVNGENLRPDWVTVGENTWRYTFTKLPMFDGDHKLIRYYAVETPVEGYTGRITRKTDTLYTYITNTLGHTTNDAYPSMNSDADLIFTAVRINYDGHLHHIWTQRVPTAEEKVRLVQLVNSDLISGNFAGDATVDNVRWVSGLPIDHEFLYSPTSEEGYKIAFAWDDRTPPQPNTIHIDVRNHSKFSNICYGTLQYNYTAGSTDFENALQPVSYSVEKNWADDEAPPKGSVITAELQGKVTRKVDPQPEGQTEPQYETVRIDLASVGVTQKIQVTLNGGAEGGDDTTANPWKYTWSNLPPCDKAGNEITYSVKEISYTIGGHTVNLNDFVPTEDSSSTPGTTTITNKIPAYSFNILKIDEGSAAALIGAKFTIREIQPASDVTDPTYVGIASASTPEITGSDGRVSFNNIPLGYYEVEEKELPPGYVLTQDQDGKFYIRVDTDSVKLLEKVITDGKLSFKEVLPGAGGRIKLGNVELTKTGNLFVLTVENTSGAALPYTGGPGTKLFTIIGSLLIAFAGSLLWRRRRTI